MPQALQYGYTDHQYGHYLHNDRYKINGKMIPKAQIFQSIMKRDGWEFHISKDFSDTMSKKTPLHILHDVERNTCLTVSVTLSLIYSNFVLSICLSLSFLMIKIIDCSMTFLSKRDPFNLLYHFTIYHGNWFQTLVEREKTTLGVQ